MPVIAVVNRKGGSGKSTLASHLAAYCSRAGLPVMLGDVDRQQSTQTWLRLREQRGLTPRSPLVGWAVDPKRVLRPPAGVGHVVLDTPGGMRGFDLARVVAFADAVIMPVCNSVFDRESAAECWAELLALPRVASARCKVAAVGMRLDSRTHAAEVLEEWAAGIDLPFIGALRETQAYVRCIEQGLTLFDLPESQVRVDLAQWQPVIEWLEPVLRPAAKPVAAAGSTPPGYSYPCNAAAERTTAGASAEARPASAGSRAEPMHGLPSTKMELPRATAVRPVSGTPVASKGFEAPSRTSRLARLFSRLTGWLPAGRRPGSLGHSALSRPAASSF